MLIFNLKIDSKGYCTAMFCFVKPVIIFIVLTCCAAYAADNDAGGVTPYRTTISAVGGNGQPVDRDSLINQFTNTKAYSEKRDIFNQLVREQDLVTGIVNLLNSQKSPQFKMQMLQFLLEMKRANDMSNYNYGAILFGVISNQPEYNKFLNPLILDQLSTDIITEFGMEESLVSGSVSVTFRLFLLRKYLDQDVCTQSVVLATIDIVKDNEQDIREREEILDLFFKVCNQNGNFESAMTALTVEPQLEWALKEKIILSHDPDYKRICSDAVLNHLQLFFSDNRDWHVRDAIIWILADVKGVCDNKIISFFSGFVQQNSEGMSIELLDFRQTMIQSILWSLVRVGFRTQNESVISELKKMAMKYDMNLYFRIRAVEALQDLSIYFSSAAQALYEIVRDNKRIPESDFVTYEQRIRDEQDTKVRDSAFIALVELLTNPTSDFLSFLSIHQEELDSDQLYRRKAFINQPIPEDRLDMYARPALTQLGDDETVDEKYHRYIQTNGLDISH